MKKYCLISALLLALTLTACGKTLTEKYTVEGNSLVCKDETLLTADTSITLTDSFLIAENSESFDIYVDRRTASEYMETATILLDDFVKIKGKFTDAALFDGNVIAADGNTLVYLVPGDAMITSENHEKLLDVSKYGALVIQDGRLMLTDGIGNPLPVEITPEMFREIPVWSWDNIDAHSIHDHGAMIRCGEDVYSVTDTGSAKKIEFDKLLTLHPIGASVVIDGKYRLLDREGKTLVAWDGYQSGMKLVPEILTDYKGEYYSDGAVYNLRFDDGTSGGFLLSYDVTTGRLLKKNGAYNFSFNADGKIDVVMNKVEHKGTFDDYIDQPMPLLVKYGETTEYYRADSHQLTKLASVLMFDKDKDIYITESGVFNSNGERMLDISRYLESNVASEVTYSITDYGFRFEYSNQEGKPVVFRWYAELPEAGNIPQDMNVIDTYYEYGGLYGDGESYWIVKDTGEITKLPLDKTYPVATMNYDNRAEFFETVVEDGIIKFHSVNVSFPKIGMLIEETPPHQFPTREFGGHLIAFDVSNISLILDKDGNIVNSVDIVAGFIKDDLLYFGFYDDINVRAVYSSSMKRFSDQPFDIFNPLDDGRYIAQVGNRYEIYTKDGDLVCRSSEFEQLLYVDDVILFVENGEMVVAEIVPGTVDYILERNTKLGEYDSSWYYHVMLSGKIQKPTGGYPAGYYFIFEDPSVTDEHGNLRSVEYYYVPETGETGIYEYFSSFAYAKPVLYLYPEETVDVTVTFPNAERLTTVYPAYNDGWRVTVQPDGTLTDARGREYYALYWEEDSGEAFYAFPDGFVVTPDNAAAFLEEKLAILGLTDREANEFIMYWLPVLERNPYNLVRFELTEEREKSMPMHITPAPDSLLRFAIHILPIDEAITIPEQKLPTFTRNGFTAVEWGGCIHS